MNRKQLSLNLNQGKRGGRRTGAGRKRMRSNGVAHRKREKLSGKTPAHINFKYKTFIKNKDCLRLLKRAIINARSHGLRVLHFSMMTNHIHLIIEADHNYTLTKGMRSLTVTFAKGLKKGKVQLERYHLHVLRSLKETKNAIQYVLFNQQKHDQTKISVIDEFTSLLQLECGLDLIRNFCKKSFITLKINRCEKRTLGEGKSYLATQGLKLLL